MKWEPICNEAFNTLPCPDLMNWLEQSAPYPRERSPSLSPHQSDEEKEDYSPTSPSYFPTTPSPELHRTPVSPPYYPTTPSPEFRPTSDKSVRPDQDQSQDDNRKETLVPDTIPPKQRSKVLAQNKTPVICALRANKEQTHRPPMPEMSPHNPHCTCQQCKDSRVLKEALKKASSHITKTHSSGTCFRSQCERACNCEPLTSTVSQTSSVLQPVPEQHEVASNATGYCGTSVL